MDYTFDKSLVLSKQTEIDTLFSKGKRVKNSVLQFYIEKYLSLTLLFKS